MILKASQRGGGKQLGQHLLNMRENEHVEVHEVSGFVADDLMGAMKEIYALSRGTKCRQYLFSVSLSPPPSGSVRIEVFEQACDRIQERLGLEGQPRIIVFHEKEGRRHAHLVVSRIDTETMTARPLPYFKSKLRDIGRELYLENGWSMPDGFRDPKLRDPRNFTLAEWQQARRAGIDAREVKGAIQDCWKMADNGPAFARALEERGLFLARGDRRGHVAVTIDGEVFSVARMIGMKSRDVAARLGDPAHLFGVADTVRDIGETVAPRLSRFIAEAKRIAAKTTQPLNERKQAMKNQHRHERKRLADKQANRHTAEQRARSARVRKGVMGAWDIMTGRYFRVRKQNEIEAFFAVQRDRAQRHDLLAVQLGDRRALQNEIVQVREQQARQLLGLYRDAARYRRMTQASRDAAERSSHGPELGR